MDAPNPIEEIDRKTVAELERVMHAFSTARMSALQALGAVQALWNATIGVVPKETMDLVVAALNTLDAKVKSDDRPDYQSVLQPYADPVPVLLQRRSATVNVVRDNATVRSETAPIDEPNPELWAQKRLVEIRNALHSKGAKVIA